MRWTTLPHVGRVVAGLGDALERMATRAIEERFLEWLGAGETLQPLAVRQLSSRSLVLTRFTSSAADSPAYSPPLAPAWRRADHIHGPDGDGIGARLQPILWETVLTLHVADDADGDSGARALGADEARSIAPSSTEVTLPARAEGAEFCAVAGRRNPRLLGAAVIKAMRAL